MSPRVGGVGFDEMMLTIARTMLPDWVTLSCTGTAIVVILLHMRSLEMEPMPASRRRIRLANGMVLLALAALMGYALGVVGMLPDGGGSAAHIRAFVLVWMAIIGLLPILLGLACLDVLNTIRLNRLAARSLRRRMREGLASDVEIRIRARLGTLAGSGTGETGGAGDDDAAP